MAKHLHIERARGPEDIIQELKTLTIRRRQSPEANDLELEDISEGSLELEGEKDFSTEKKGKHQEELESVTSSGSDISLDFLQEDEEDEKSRRIRKEILGVLKPRFKLPRVRRKIVWAPEDEGRISSAASPGVKDNLTIIVKNPELYDYRVEETLARATWRTREGRTSSLQAIHRNSLQHRLQQKRFLERFPQ